MRKYLLILISAVFLFADAYKYAENILGKETYSKYENVIKSSLDENATLKNTLVFLKNNGLVNLYFDKIKTIHPTFVFINNNPVFNTKNLYDILKNMGYYSFYPVNIHKDTNYTVTIEMKSQNHIDPLDLLNAFEKRGCKLTDIEKNSSFKYVIDCENEKLLNTIKLKEETQALHNINGIYWIETEDFNKIKISTSKYDFWHPYVVFYDTNLNILNIISTSDLIRKKTFDIPLECKYIKITDSFTKENIKRGIFIKGLK